VAVRHACGDDILVWVVSYYVFGVCFLSHCVSTFQMYEA
jgi:hypothetical protein